MRSIILLYEQLELKLQGTSKGKYTAQELIEAKDNLHVKVDEALTDLMNMTYDTIKKTEDASSAAKIVGSSIMEGLGVTQKELQALKISESGWGGILRSTLSWDSLSRLQREKLDQTLSLLHTSIGILQENKGELVQLLGYLDRFWEAVKYARITNDRDIMMGLDAQDLLTLYRENLVKTKEAIDYWE
jgi:hypothetical protein